jgi:RES domain-containing protein
MHTTWRIVKRRYASSAFDGEGARLYGGRWNSPGTPVVYTAESRALATLELLAGLQSSRSLESYVLISVSFPEDLVEILDPRVLSPRWRDSPPSLDSQSIGDLWIHEQRTAILKVPSVIIPQEANYIVNPHHQEFSLVVIGEVEALHIDPRLEP